jgi:hypothetical protein
MISASLKSLLRRRSESIMSDRKFKSIIHNWHYIIIEESLWGRLYNIYTQGLIFIFEELFMS